MTRRPMCFTACADATAPRRWFRTTSRILLDIDRLTGECEGTSLFSDDPFDREHEVFRWANSDFLSYQLRLESRYQFEVQGGGGAIYYGSIGVGSSKDHVGGLRPAGGDLEAQSVVASPPIEEKFIDRFQGSVEVGYSFLRAKRRSQLTVQTELQFRRPKYWTTAALTA